MYRCLAGVGSVISAFYLVFVIVAAVHPPLSSVGFRWLHDSWKTLEYGVASARVHIRNARLSFMIVFTCCRIRTAIIPSKVNPSWPSIPQ